jgi:hypothetical protein
MQTGFFYTVMFATQITQFELVLVVDTVRTRTQDFYYMSYFLFDQFFHAYGNFNISSFSEHDNTVFIGHINAYFDYVLLLDHIFTNICIIVYFWSYLDRFLTFCYISFIES